MAPTFSKKVSWILLATLFTFDDIISYWAVTYKGAHESDFLIAWIVEKYPLTYFLCIPATILIMFLIVKFLTNLAVKMFKKVKREVVEQVILTALVFYWALGNSSMNSLYLIGHLQPAYVWYWSTTICFILTTIYVIAILQRLNKKKV